MILGLALLRKRLGRRRGRQAGGSGRVGAGRRAAAGPADAVSTVQSALNFGVQLTKPSLDDTLYQ